MKKLSLIAALTLSTMLSACGGGGGGGHSFIPPTTLPDNPGPVEPSNPGDDSVNVIKNTNITEMNPRVLSDSSALTDLVKSTDGLEDVYAGVEQTTARKAKARFAAAKANDKNICKSENDCNRELFNNMVRILVENNLENAGVTEIKRALLLAGFTQQDLSGHIDDLKAAQEYIRTHQDEIKSNLDKFFNDYTTVTIADAKLHLVEQDETGGQNSLINLTLNKDGKIDGIEISKGKASPLKYTLERVVDNNQFDKEQTIYRYGINNPYFSGIYVESLEPLTPTEWKKRLKNQISEIEPSLAFDENDKEHNHQLAEELRQAVDDITDYVEGDTRGLSEEEELAGVKELFNMSYTKKESIKYTSYAKDMKLAYSDFGMIDITGGDTYKGKTAPIDETKVFAGGYETKKIDPTKIAGTITFNGKAIGAVNYIGYANQTGVDDSQVAKKLDLKGNDNNATLEFNNGAQTLTALFNNWYDVTATTDTNGKGDITFDGTNKTIDKDFKFHEMSSSYDTPMSNEDFKYKDSYTVNDFTTSKQIKTSATGHSEPSYGAMQVGYYGDDNIPNEATGFVYYSEGFGYTDKNGQERGDRLLVNIGFGAQRQ